MPLQTNHIIGKMCRWQVAHRHVFLCETLHTDTPLKVKKRLRHVFFQWTCTHSPFAPAKAMYSETALYDKRCMQRRVRKLKSRVETYRSSYIDRKLGDRHGVMC